LNFGQTTTVSFLTREPRRHERAQDVERQLNSDYTRAETQYIAIVVFA
jgi:hypothetical protein